MVRLNRIYTRTGDDGTTGLVDGSRRAKHDPRIAAVGDIDELNSALGLARIIADAALESEIARIQNDLFDLGADLATPVGAYDSTGFVPTDMVLRIVPGQVAWLEAAIDRHNEPLPPLTSFILPGGSELAARLHLGRSIARRAERAMTALAAVEDINPAALHYVNRLSDYLFVVARAVNAGTDPLWVPGASR